METAIPRVDPVDRPGFDAAETLASIRTAFLIGTLVSALGFALPWFRINRDYRWWYGGWHLLTTNEPDLAWIALIFIGYALLLLAGWFLPHYGLAGTILLATVALSVVCSTLIVVALAAADAINGSGQVYRLDLNLGLLLLVIGHGALSATAIAGVAVQAVGAVLAGRAG